MFLSQEARTEVRATLSLGLPIITAQIASMSLGFADTVMAGKISPVDLGAIAIGRSFYSPLFIFALGIMVAVTPIVAQHYGAGRLREITSATRHGIWVSVIISLPAFFIMRQLHRFMPMMDMPAEIIPITTGYLDALSWGLPATMAYLALRFFNEGISISRPHMYLSIAAIPLNVGANYVLMFGKLGFPALGAVGAGYATAIVWWCLLVAMVLLVARGHRYREFHILERFEWPSREGIMEIFRLGIPIAASLTMEVSMFAVIALMIGRMGVEVVASHQVAINFASMTFMVPLGVAIASTSRVGYFVGAGSMRGARTAGNVGMGICLLFSIISALGMFIFPEYIVAIYTEDAAVTQIAVVLLFWAGVFQLSDGMQASASGALRGLKDTRIPMVVNLASYWAIGLPVGYVLAVQQGMGAEGFWMGMVAGLTVAAILHPLRFYRMTGSGAGAQDSEGAAGEKTP